MKSIRILFACVLAAFASVVLVRAEAEKKADGTTVEKKEEKKADAGCGCSSGGCDKPEKKEEKKS
jgi:hypothetical protein